MSEDKQVVAIIFEYEDWTKSECMEWLEDRGYRWDKASMYCGDYRFDQVDDVPDVCDCGWESINGCISVLYDNRAGACVIC